MEISWQDKFATSISWIDEQHKQIIQTTKIFVESLSGRSNKDDIKKAMNILNDMVDNHFEMEESYMDRYRYDHIAEHKNQHKNYYKVIEILEREYDLDPDSPELCKKIETVFYRYWNDHIPDYDLPLAAFIRKNHDN